MIYVLSFVSRVHPSSQILSYVHNDGISYSYNVPADTSDPAQTYGEDYKPSMVFIDGGILISPSLSHTPVTPSQM